jgi:hypothetical protein
METLASEVGSASIQRHFFPQSAAALCSFAFVFFREILCQVAFRTR